ncbi:Carnitine operon protein CaiE [compost metagenome]
MGAPARVSRQLTDKEVRWKQAGTREYQVLAQRCREAMEECEPLREVEAMRPRLPASAVKPKGAE